MTSLWGFVKCVFILKLLAKYSEYIIVIFMLHVSQSQNHQWLKLWLLVISNRVWDKIPTIFFFFKSYAVLVYRLDLHSAFDEYMCTIFLLIQNKIFIKCILCIYVVFLFLGFTISWNSWDCFGPHIVGED